MRRSCVTITLFRFALGMLVLALALAGGCATRRVAKPGLEVPPECRFSPAASSAAAPSDGASHSGAPLDEAAPITFALLEPVDLARAPWAGNASERILFHHLYETLTAIDCTGAVRPALAESWTSEDGGRAWTFDLARDARFWDGSRVTAADVVAGWSDALTLPTGVDSVRALDDRRLRVWLRMPPRDLPRLLSASFFAVTKTSGDSRWLMGSGPYRIGGVDATAFPSARRVITVYPSRDRGARAIRFVQVSGASAAEARDLLERGADVMVTADPAVVEYASGESRFAMAALPWEKTYVLVSPSRAIERARGWKAPEIPFEVRDALARDAVRSDARAWEPPSWWDAMEECDGATSTASSVSSALRPSSDDRRIIYEENDPVARDLAERIAALTVVDTVRSREARAFARAVPGFSGAAGAARAEGVTRRVFAGSLRRGDDFAYIVAMPRETYDPCEEMRGLDFSRGLIPLVDTRSRAIVRQGRVDLLIDGWGGVRVISPVDVGGEGR